MAQQTGFFRKLSELWSKDRQNSGLTELLSQSTAGESLYSKMFWFEELLAWLVKDSPQQSDVRFRFFFRVLEKNPEWRENLVSTFHELLDECTFTQFLTKTGFSPEESLWSDIVRRVFERIIPTVGSTDFREIVLGVFRTEDEIEWLVGIPDEVVLQLKALFFPIGFDPFASRFNHEFRQALLLLSTHVAHHGLSFEIRSRVSTGQPIEESSFLQLSVEMQKVMLTQAEEFNLNVLEKSDIRFFEMLKNCEEDLQKVRDNVEKMGVSVSLVSRLEVLKAMIEQMKTLLVFEVKHSELDQSRNALEYMTFVARAGIRDRSIREHLSQNFYLLSKKIVERNSLSGDHYIARTSGERGILFWSALGGGVIVVGMTLLKTLMIHLQPAPIFLAFSIWIVYSGGFLLMQFTGCTLATKLPSFMANFLAEMTKISLRSESEHQRSEMKKIVKSQAIALVGNIMGVVPFAIFLSWAYQSVFQSGGIFSNVYSVHLLQDLNPFASAAVILGILTGLQLWMSSVAGGWFDNWVTFSGVIDTIRNHPKLKKIFGQTSANRAADWLEVNASGIATNIALGFLFGFFPLLGAMLGLNLNGNHVTISTAGASFALASLNFDVTPLQLWLSILGLFLIGVMNFVVSFSMALFVAAKAQSIPLSRIRRPWKKVD